MTTLFPASVLRSRVPTGPVARLTPEELIPSCWDPFLSRRDFGEFLWQDPEIEDSLTRMTWGGHLLFTSRVDTRVRRASVRSVQRRGEGLIVAMDFAAQDPGGPEPRGGQDIQCSWFDAGAWLAVRGHVRGATRARAVLELPRHAWRFALLPGHFERVESLMRLFVGFDPTLADRAGLQAVSHPANVEAMLVSAHDWARPALVRRSAMGTLHAGRFALNDQQATQPRAGGPVDVVLANIGGPPEQWVAGEEVTVSSIVHGETVGFTTRVGGVTGRALHLETPQSYVRWDRRVDVRVAVGSHSGFELLLPVATPGTGKALAHARTLGVLDLSTGGISFVADLTTLRAMSAGNDPALLEVHGAPSVPLPLRLLRLQPFDAHRAVASAAFGTLGAMAERAVWKVCERLSGGTLAAGG